MFYKLGAAGRALRKVGAIDFATTIAPGLRDVLLTGKITRAELRRGLTAAGLPTDAATVAGLQAEAKAHLTRRELEESLRSDLAEVDRPLVELPFLDAGVDRAGLD